MKKIVRLTESDLTRIVKRVINESGRFNNVVKSLISRFFSDIKMKELDRSNVVFVNNNGTIIFRYDLDDRNLYYGKYLYDFVLPLISAKLEGNDENVLNMIGSWVEENFVSKFSDEFEKEFGFEFMIDDVFMEDESWDEWDEDDEDDEDDEEDVYIPNNNIYQKQNSYGLGNPNAEKRGSVPMEYLNSFNDLDVIDRDQPQRMTLLRYEEGNNMFVALPQSSDHNVVYVNGKIWFTLKEKYGLSGDEIRNLIKEWIVNTFDINVSHPNMIKSDHHINFNGRLEGGIFSRRT